MKCSLLLHTQRVDLGREFVSAESVTTIARAAETAGFDSVSVTDHPMPHDEWMASGGCPPPGALRIGSWDPGRAPGDGGDHV
jgi:alkanesulfonate monooxygenase SsuD/methylene tetrahydromethanopterin reductase-like flavin-dependent oxidoreductase (luciferase family)